MPIELHPRFGAVCLGDTRFLNSTDDVGILPNCPLVSVINGISSPGTAYYRFYLSTESVRADKWFFALQFDAPVQSVTAARFDNTTLSADALYVHTGSEQVIGLYSEYSLDPMTEAVMDVVIAFPAEYSTLCIEVANCSRCSRDSIQYTLEFSQKS